MHTDLEQLKNITIASLPKAHRVKYNGFTAVLSIESPVFLRGKRLRFSRFPCPDQLVLEFDDLDDPVPGFVFPSKADVESIIFFGRKHVTSSLLIHCFKGISRSTAAALVILADRFGKGQEKEALASLLNLCPKAVPNLALIRYADHLLDRNHALIRVVSEWDSANKRNQIYRHRNRMAVTRPEHRSQPI